VLIHGFGETGDMWSPMAAESRRTTPSSCPTCAHGPVLAPRRRLRQWTQAGDIRAVLDKLGIDAPTSWATTSA